MVFVVLRSAKSGRAATSVEVESSMSRRATSEPSWVGTRLTWMKSQPWLIARSKAERLSSIRSSAAPPSAMIAGDGRFWASAGSAAAPAAAAAAPPNWRRVRPGAPRLRPSP
jgi:hypothetical protein